MVQSCKSCAIRETTASSDLSSGVECFNKVKEYVAYLPWISMVDEYLAIRNNNRNTSNMNDSNRFSIKKSRNPCVVGDGIDDEVVASTMLCRSIPRGFPSKWTADGSSSELAWPCLLRARFCPSSHSNSSTISLMTSIIIRWCAVVSVWVSTSTW